MKFEQKNLQLVKILLDACGDSEVHQPSNLVIDLWFARLNLPKNHAYVWLARTSNQCEKEKKLRFQSEVFLIYLTNNIECTIINICVIF